MHAISTITTADGRTIVEAMYANRPAWHGLGTVFDPDGDAAADSETAIELAHLDWHVSKEQLYLGCGSPAADCFATVRDDTGDVLGAVGARYSVLQNRESFRFLDSLAQDNAMRYESAFALHGGRQVALLARMPSVDQIADGDDQLRYVMLRSSHDGSAAVDLVPTSVRVVCANTVRAAIDAAGDRRLSIRHTGDLNGKLAQARRYLALFDKRFTDYADAARRLAETPYTREQATHYIDELFPAPKQGSSERTRKAHGRRVMAVRHAFNHASNQLPAIKGMWWQLVNSVTYAVDHAREFNKRQGDRRRAEASFLANIDGDGSRIKAKALQTALATIA